MKFVQSRSATALTLLAAMLTGGAAQASVVYSYAGQTFASVVDTALIPGAFIANVSLISGSFTVANTLAANMLNQAFTPDSFAFSDSRYTYTEANSLYRHVFKASTDANGDLTQWQVELQDIDPITSSLDPLLVAHRLVTRTLVFVQDGAWHYVCGPGNVTVALCDNVNYDLLADDQVFQQARAGSWTRRNVIDSGPNPIPLPGTLPLVLAGLAGWVFSGRFRNRAGLA